MLSQEQLAQYDRDGYVLVSGLIPEETIANAEAAMWSVLGMDRDDPASWSPLPDDIDGVTTTVSQGVIEHFGVQDPALLACCTPAFYEVQSQLVRENAEAFHCQKPQPEAVWTRSVFPVSKGWNSSRWACRWRTSTLQCLSRIIPRLVADVSRFRCCAGWRYRGLARIAPEATRGGGAVTLDRYRMLPDLKNPQQRFDLGEPVELRPSRGDVLFFHYLLVHAGSLNTSNKPRFALRLMCTCDTCRIWEKYGRWNIWMP